MGNLIKPISQEIFIKCLNVFSVMLHKERSNIEARGKRNTWKGKTFLLHKDKIHLKRGNQKAKRIQVKPEVQNRETIEKEN